MTLFLQIILSVVFLAIIVGSVVGAGFFPKKREDESSHLPERETITNIRNVEVMNISASTTTTVDPNYFNNFDEPK